MRNKATPQRTAQATASSYPQTSSCPKFITLVRKVTHGVVALHKCKGCAKSTKENKSGDSCQFFNFREVVADINTPGAYKVLFRDTNKQIPQQIPRVFIGKPSSKAEILAKQYTVACHLHSVVKQANEFEKAHPDIIRRVVQWDTRALCDQCSSPLFACTWFCTYCGAEFCDLCCTQGLFVECASKKLGHVLLPSSSFAEHELEQKMDSIERTLEGMTARSCAELLANPVSPAPTEVVSIDIHDLSDATIHAHLSAGVPLVIRNANREFRGDWSPDGVVQSVRDEQVVQAEDCESKNTMATTVSDFFANFGQETRSGAYAEGSGIWKLSDWPTAGEFAHTLPDLHADYLRAMVAPSFTDARGPMNLISHMPENSKRPDLGPKMYSAYGSVVDEDHHGSTRLHVDQSDAANIMMYSSQQGSSSRLRAGATWIVVHRDDRSKLAQFLEKRHQCERPLHSWDYYITDSIFSEMRDYGIRIWRYVQEVGDALIIPAGCAHQVSNHTDTIKIACDYVSVHALPTLFALSAEFREQRLLNGEEWPPALIPLEYMIYYAYDALCEMKKHLQQEVDLSGIPSSSNTTPAYEDSSNGEAQIVVDTSKRKARDRQRLKSMKAYRKELVGAVGKDDKAYWCPSHSCAAGTKHTLFTYRDICAHLKHRHGVGCFPGGWSLWALKPVLQFEADVVELMG